MAEPDPDSAPLHPPSSAGREQLLIPDGHAELVFRLAGSFSRWRLDEPAKRTQMSSSYVIGGRSHSVLTRSAGGLRLAGAKLDPRALRELVGMPLSEFRDHTVSCRDLGRRELSQLEDAVANADSADLVARVFDRFFLQRDYSALRDDTAIEPLLRKIRATHGAQSILAWARDHRIDPRTLERRFTAGMGMTPKQFARIERFKHSYHELVSRPDAKRPHLEAYYDESHFSREFRNFLGTSRGDWRNQTAPYRTTIGDHLLDGEFQGAAD